MNNLKKIMNNAIKVNPFDSFMRMKIFIFFLALILGCSNSGENLEKKALERDYKILTLFSIYRETGECLRIQSETTKTNYICSKYSRGLCTANLLITTSGEKNKNLFEVGTLLEKRPECAGAIFFSGIQNLNVTSLEEERTLKSENEFKAVNSCIPENFSNYEKLATQSELKFLNSTRGIIGKGAEKILNSIFTTDAQKQDADTCLTNEFSNSERELISDIIENRKLEEDSYSINK